MALERLTYDRAAKAVTYRSDKSEGPTAGTETADPLEFLALVLVHIPDKGHVTTRYYGWYSNRPRGMRRQAKPAAADAPVPIVTPPRLAPTTLGGVATADLRGRPARVPAMRRPDANRGVHHAVRGDRPDTDAPPHPRCLRRRRGSAQRAESALGRLARHSWARIDDRPRARRPSPLPERRPVRPGSPVGCVRRARRSRIGPAPRGDDPRQGRPNDPRRGQTGERPHPDRTRARGPACSVAPYFYAPIEIPIAQMLRGHYGYYGITGNANVLSGFFLRGDPCLAEVAAPSNRTRCDAVVTIHARAEAVSASAAQGRPQRLPDVANPWTRSRAGPQAARTLIHCRRQQAPLPPDQLLGVHCKRRSRRRDRVDPQSTAFDRLVQTRALNGALTRLD